MFLCLQKMHKPSNHTTHVDGMEFYTRKSFQMKAIKKAFLQVTSHHDPVIIASVNKRIRWDDIYYYWMHNMQKHTGIHRIKPSFAHLISANSDSRIVK